MRSDRACGTFITTTPGSRRIHNAAAQLHTHPLTDDQNAQIAGIAHAPIEEVRTVRVQIDQEEALEPQIARIVDGAGLSSYEWQTRRALLVNSPGYAPAAFVLLAELHGRIGHFPALVRLRPKSGPSNV